MPSPFLEESTYVLQKHTRTFSGVNGTGQEGLSPVYYSGAAVVRVRLLYSLFFSRSVPRPFFFFYMYHLSDLALLWTSLFFF